jgi:hypothetical protein
MNIKEALDRARKYSLAIWSKYGQPLLATAFLLGLVFFVWHFSTSINSELSSGKYVGEKIAITVISLFTLFALVLIVRFLRLFRGIKADENSLNSIVTYCYAFIAFSLLAPLVPFIVLPLIPKAGDVMLISPISIVRGCSIPYKTDKERGSVPKELICDDETDQWIINIGGSIVKAPNNTQSSSVVFPLVRITGGLVVPLYVVVVALMGAAVSMTRRVPEYQRRLSPGDPEYMTYDQARESLVFQIMQVISAPLIAITIYYLVNPGSRVSTIVVGFASGFSSETVLLLIRDLMEKISPEKRRYTLQKALVQIVPARLDFGNVAIGKNLLKTIGIENHMATNLNISSITCAGGEFRIITSLPLTISASASAAIEIEFIPKTEGTKKALLMITDNAPGSPRAADLTGVGTTATG